MPHHPAHESSAPLPDAKPSASAIALKPGQTLVFFGDSITAATPGYLDVLAQVLNDGPVRLDLTLVNAGVPGDTIHDLHRRLAADVLSRRPDWVFILIGTNDLLGNSSGAPNGVPVADFEARLDELVAKLLASGTRPVLMTLTLVAEELDESVAPAIKEYNAAIKSVASRRVVPLIDLQRAFRDLYDRATTYKQQVTLFSDGVHPDFKGHTLIARAIITTLGVLRKNG